MITRVSATPAALQLIAELQGRHGPLMFHQSGGCCDGSSPMCFGRGEFLVGEADVLLGEIGGQPFYMSESQFEYWMHTHLIIDVVPGHGETIVYNIGTLYGEWPDGTPFEGNRYVDRFVVRGGKIIRMDSKTIRESGRNAQGVRLLNMEPGDKVAAAVVIAPEEEPNGGNGGTLIQ